MDFEHVEKLQREYTDKYVIVDDTRSELQRFKGLTGTVKTVNMKGRSLVEFDGHNNRGWYDIDIDFLKVIDEPLPKEEKEEKKPAPKAKKAPSELEKARSEKEAKATAGAEAQSAPAEGSVEQKADEPQEAEKMAHADEQESGTVESEAPQETVGEDKAPGDASG